MPASRSRRRLIALFIISTLGGACQEEGTVTVHSVRFVGIRGVDEGRLKAAIATRENSILPWGRRALFDRSRLDTDLKRIQTFYDDRGYPDARATAVDVRLNDSKTEVDILVTIDEGEPVVVSAVHLRGFDVLPAEQALALEQQESVQVGRPRDRRDVLAVQDEGLTYLRDEGYPYARVSIAEQPAGSDKLVEITFTADAGTRADFGAIEITGNVAVSRGVIERQLVFREGDLYRRRLVRESQRRLYRMELFQFVNIVALEPEGQDSQVPTRVTVVEGRHQRVNFGVGYGTEDKVRLDGEYRHLNFFGAARTAGATGKWSSLDRGLRLNATQPYFLHPRLSLGGEAQYWRTVAPAYRSLIFGGRVAITYQVDPITSWSTFISREDTSSSISDDALSDPTIRDDLIAIGLDPTTGKQEGTFGTIGVNLQRATIDDLADPHSGYQLAAQAEQTGVILPSSFDYWAVSFDGRHYLPMGETFVLASRLQAGTIVPADRIPANVPFSKKYFLGGATSLRGWGRFQVGPLSESGLPIGGNTLFALNVEWRASAGNWGGVAFLDAGNVWADELTIKPDELRYAIGAGLRYRTPVGPIRVDYGYQLNPVDGLVIDGESESRRWRLHFSVGQAF